jgi:isopentenyl-diphosphate delta-isomerase
MPGKTNERKIEHVDVIYRDPEVERNQRYFDRYHLRHRALPDVDLAAVDTRVGFLGKQLSMPLLISSMTGGDHERLRTINRNLAIAAEATGVAMAVGSQRVMFGTPAARESFALREHAPTVPLIANVGAVQLNYGFGLGECEACIEVLGADGLYLHLNPLQEAVQPEGDTNFDGLSEKIRELAPQLDVPVLLKEVGAGLGARDVEAVLDAGIHHFDVAGSGGTSWSRIEHHRSNEDCDLGITFQDWGLPTPLAIEELSRFGDRITVIASGGIRNGIDMVKAMALGASVCGLARPFLASAEDSSDAVIARIERLRREFTVALFLLGLERCDYLIGNRAVFLAD